MGAVSKAKPIGRVLLILDISIYTVYKTYGFPYINRYFWTGTGTNTGTDYIWKYVMWTGTSKVLAVSSFSQGIIVYGRSMLKYQGMRRKHVNAMHHSSQCEFEPRKCNAFTCNVQCNEACYLYFDRSNRLNQKFDFHISIDLSCCINVWIHFLLCTPMYR